LIAIAALAVYLFPEQIRTLIYQFDRLRAR
jgi:hypothetical protein